MSKVAIVTGGNSGLGFATAKKLCENGIKTYIVGRNKERTESAALEIGAIPYLFDLGNLEGIPNMIKEIANNGNIDILVNNAGIHQKKEFTEVTDKDFANIMNINVQSVFAVSREVVKVMKKNGGGSIINISSMASQYGLPKVIAYSASKGGVVQLTKSLANTWAKDNIQVNAVLPGYIDTTLTRQARVDIPELQTRVEERTPLGRWGVPDDLGGIAVFLSGEGSNFVTGTAIPVDGGYSING